MLTVEDYGQIRRLHGDGVSIRAVARTLHHSRRKVREAVANPEPRRYTRTKDPPAPVLGPFKALIDAILAADEQAPRKQRHTATQVFRSLVAQQYAGSYDQVRRYIRQRRQRQRETFIPLAHDPGRPTRLAWRACGPGSQPSSGRSWSRSIRLADRRAVRHPYQPGRVTGASTSPHRPRKPG